MPSLKPRGVGAVSALVAIGVVMILAGVMLGSQVVWRPSSTQSGPTNVTIPAGDGFANGGYGSRGQFATTRLVAAWFTSNPQSSGLQFEVLLHVGPGALMGILNSSELDNATLLASYPPSISSFGTADVTFSANVGGQYFLAPVLVNASPNPVTLTDYGVAWESPYSPNGQAGWALEIGGTALVLMSTAYAIAAFRVSRRNTGASVLPGP